MTDAISIRWTPTDARPRKVVFEPRPVGGFHRLEYEHRDGEWRLLDEEAITDLDLEAPAAIITGGSCSNPGP